MELSAAEPPEKRIKDWKHAWALADDVVNEEKVLEDTLKCPVCHEPEAQQTDGNGMRLCCFKCGFVFDNIPDDRPDFNGKQQEVTSHANTDPDRVETVNPLMPHASMNTDISFTGRLAFRQYAEFVLCCCEKITRLKTGIRW